MSQSSNAATQVNEQSAYNDGKGIQISVQFTPLPPPLKHGSKRRKNAKVKPINAIYYIHEENDLHGLLGLGFVAVKRTNFSYTFDRDGALVTDEFSASYTIARTDAKDISLTCIHDYEALLALATEKPKPQVKLFLEELSQGLAEDEQSEEEEEIVAKKKKKGPSSEEVEQNRLIQNLTQKYQCEDRSCSYTTCWPDATTGQHIHLTHQHLRTWAAAIEAKMDGINIDHPPNSKLFDLGHHNPADVATLSRRRQALQNSNSAPIVINNDFNMKELLGFMRGDKPASSLEQPGRLSTIPSRKISLQAFCERYGLTESIYVKLSNLHVTGPHSLRFITDAQLRDDGGLCIGELGDVRDAQERWTMNGDTEN